MFSRILAPVRERVDGEQFTAAGLEQWRRDTGWADAGRSLTDGQQALFPHVLQFNLLKTLIANRENDPAQPNQTSIRTVRSSYTTSGAESTNLVVAALGSRAAFHLAHSRIA